MEWWDGEAERPTLPWLELDQKEDASSNTDHHDHSKTEVAGGRSASSGLHDLVLAALPEEETPTAVSIPPRKRNKYYHQHRLELSAPTHPPERPSFVQAPKGRELWASVVSEQDKAQKALLDAQSALEKAKFRLSEANERMKNTRQDIFLNIIKEDKNWFESYQLIKYFKAQHGHTIVPRAPKKEMAMRDPSLSKLSKWVGVNRRDFRRGDLDEFKVFALNQIGFDWDPSHTNWMNKYNLLVDFKNKNGHTKVKYNVQKDAPDDGGLGAWVKRQQYQYKLFQEEKPSELTLERIKLLDDIGMIWKRRGESWMNRYKELEKFKIIHGHLNVTAELNASLFAWVRDQRAHWKKFQADPTQSSLTSKQVALLEEVGFQLDLREAQWKQRIEELKRFKQIHGHTCVPSRYAFNQQLSSWWAGQRRQYNLLIKGEKSQLTKERAKELLDIGFDLVSNKKQKIKKTWEEVFADLREFKKEKGHLKVADGSILEKWCEKQREAMKMFHQGEPLSLTRDQIEKLDSLDFDWGAAMTPQVFQSNVASWEEKFGEFLAYCIQNNSYEIPSDRQDLSDWIDEQSVAWGRVSQLEQLGVSLHGRKTVVPTWEDMYLELLKYRLANGTFHVPIEKRNLHDWCHHQRLAFKQMQGEGEKSAPPIAVHRLSKLKKVDFPWDESNDESLSVGRTSPIHAPDVPPREKPSPILEGSLTVEAPTPGMETNLQYGPLFPLDLAPIAAPNDIAWPASQPSPRYLHPALPANSLLGTQDSIMQLSHEDDDHSTGLGDKSLQETRL